MNHGAKIYEFYDYYSMVPQQLQISSIIFALGAAMFGGEEAYDHETVDLNESIYTGIFFSLK